MACIKVAPGPYHDHGCLHRLIHEYIYPKSVYIGGINIDPQYASTQMEIIKDIWMQTTGVQLWHFILSFSETESAQYANPTDAQYIAYEICEFFADKYQVVFGIHAGINLHIHFVINSISYLDGSRFVNNKASFNDLRKHVSFTLNRAVDLFFN